MDKEYIKKLQQAWYDENAEFGKELGYPDCCIKEFCLDHPKILEYKRNKGIPPSKEDLRRFKAAHVDGNYTGFIPCNIHAKQINEGKITLASLIVNRSSKFGMFPNPF